jgi:hypothetical protein
MKKNMSLTVLTLILSFLTVNLFSQEEKEGENAPVYVKDAVKGYIIDTSGKKVVCYIKLMGTDKTPWINQRIVKGIEESKLNPLDSKQKFEKYNKSEILGYGTDTRHFKMIEFVNIRASIKTSTDGKEATIFDQAQSFKNLSKQKHFAEVLVDGTYKIYKLHGYPKDIDIVVGSDETVKKQEAEELDVLINKYSLLIQKENGKIEFLKIDDLEKITKDCEAIKKKLENGDYNALGYEKPKKKGLMGKMAALAGDQHIGNSKHQKLFVQFFSDLNSQCK